MTEIQRGARVDLTGQAPTTHLGGERKERPAPRPEMAHRSFSLHGRGQVIKKILRRNPGPATALPPTAAGWAESPPRARPTAPRRGGMGASNPKGGEPPTRGGEGAPRSEKSADKPGRRRHNWPPVAVGQRPESGGAELPKEEG